MNLHGLGLSTRVLEMTPKQMIKEKNLIGFMNRCEDKVTKTFHGWLLLSWGLVGSWLNVELECFLKDVHLIT